MLKRIKETLTCNSSGRKRESRTINRLKSHHLLHSDKSTYTYFYKNKVRSLLYSNKVSTIPLVLSAFGLLLVLGLSVGCVGGASGVDAYAEGENEIAAQSDSASVSLSLADTANNGNMTTIGENKSIQEQVDTTNNTGYIAVDFHVTATNIDKYDVYVQSSNSALIGETNGGKVESISSNTTYSDMIKNAGWGYAVAEGSNVNAETLTYKPIQTSASSAVDSGSATNTTVNKDYTLAFAANLTGATADHYKSDITLSVAAGATQVMTLYSVTYNTNNSTAGTAPAIQSATSANDTYSFTVPMAEQIGLMKEGYWFMGWSTNQYSDTAEYGLLNPKIILTKDVPNLVLYAIWGIPSWHSATQMQHLTTEICGTAPENATKQLIDVRDNNIYWVAKLKDGNCWMTQNMAYEAEVRSDAGYSAVNKDKVLNGGATEDIGTKTLSTDSTSLAVYPTSTTYNGHYRLGNYYSQAQRNDVCVISGSDWQLPTASQASSSSANGSFGKLFGVYGVSDNASGSAIIRTTPMFFIYSGVYNGGAMNVGTYGTYWSSTNDSYNTLYVANDKASPRFDYTGWFGSSGGYSVRCVVVGN